MAKPDVSKMTVSIPAKDADKLETIAKKHASTKTTALVRAIRTTAFLEEAADSGERLFLEDENGNKREVVFQ